MVNPVHGEDEGEKGADDMGEILFMEWMKGKTLRRLAGNPVHRIDERENYEWSDV